MTAIEHDIIGTKKKSAPVDLGPLFASEPEPSGFSTNSAKPSHIGDGDSQVRREQPAGPTPGRPHTSSDKRSTPANAGASDRRRVRRPDDFAENAIRSDDTEVLTDLATRAFKVRAEFDGQVEAWQVLLDMIRSGVLEGTESTDFLGACGRRAELVACEVTRVPMTLPDEYTRDPKGQPVAPEIIEAMRGVLKRKHGNRCTVWRRPTTPTQRAAAIAEAQGVR